MRPILVLAFLLAAGPGVAADLSDPRFYLSETAYDEVKVSPDGSSLAFLARKNDFEKDREDVSLWIARLDQPSEPVLLAPLPGGGSGLRWSPDGRLLSLLSADEGTGTDQIVLADPAGGAPRRLTNPARFADGISFYDWLPDGSGVIFAATEPVAESVLATQKKLEEFYGDVRRSPGPPAPKIGIYRLSLLPAGAAPEHVGTAPFEILVDLRVSPDGWWAAIPGYDSSELTATSELVFLPLGPQAVGPRKTRNLTWEEAITWSGSNDLLVIGMGEEEDGRFAITEERLYRLEPQGGDLVRIAPEIPGSVLQAVPLADGSVLATAVVSTHIRVYLVEPGGRVRQIHENQGFVANVSASRDGRRIAFVGSDARHFPEIYLAEGRDGFAKARPVTRFNAALSASPLPEIETVSWKNSGGDTIEGVLFWPPGRKGEKGLPLMVDLHGGPFGTARVESVGLIGSFMSYPSLLASRGFLVLNVNYRGGGGRGDAFTRAVALHHCSRPANDVITGAESMVARGWADRERMGIIGYSYGGVVTTCTISFSDLFRAASAGAGRWSNVTYFAGNRRAQSWAETFYGGKYPWEDINLYWQESPVSRTNRVKTPTLAVYGERDGVTATQAGELYRSLVLAGVPAELLIFPGEGHIFRKPAHKLTKIRAEISWFEHYLLGKPRAELP